MFKNRVVRKWVEIMYAFVIMLAIGKWAIHVAYLERGYEAIGGEYCLILMTYWAAWKTIHYLFGALEDLKYERSRK